MINTFVNNKNCAESIILPLQSYNFENDSRLLIPYISQGLIGFINKQNGTMTAPKYISYFGECYKETDFIRVASIDNYKIAKNPNSTFNNRFLLYGLLNANGEEVLPLEYTKIIMPINSAAVYTVEGKDGKYKVVTYNGEEIVPSGKYNLIGGFDSGVARVKIVDNNGECKWGLINEIGEVVCPIEYDDLWNFYGKNRNSTKLVKNGIVSCFNFPRQKEHLIKSTNQKVREKRRISSIILDIYNAIKHCITSK